MLRCLVRGAIRDIAAEVCKWHYSALSDGTTGLPHVSEYLGQRDMGLVRATKYVKRSTPGTVNNLGRVYLLQGRLQGEEVMYQCAVWVCQLLHDEESFLPLEVLEMFKNMGDLVVVQGGGGGGRRSLVASDCCHMSLTVLSACQCSFIHLFIYFFHYSVSTTSWQPI